MNPKLYPRSFTQQLTLLLCLVFAGGAIGWWVFSAQRIEEVLNHQIALRAQVQSAQLSSLPSLIDAVQARDTEAVMAIIEKVQQASDADFITVSDELGVRLAHPIQERIGLSVVGDDIERALTTGESYLSHSVGSLGPSVRYISPIIAFDGRIVGMIKVGYLQGTVTLWNDRQLESLLMFAVGALLISSFLAWFFSRFISHQMQNLEPWQVAQTLRTQQGVLQVIHEGVIAVNRKGRVYVINESAKQLVSRSSVSEQTALDLMVDDPTIFSLSGADYIDRLSRVNGRHVVITRVSLSDKEGQTIGAVFSLRAHQEMLALSDKLSQVNQYIESLRVTRHEYQNKLSIIAGLLQMGKVDKALALTLAQSRASQQQLDSLIHLNAFPQLSALLLSKQCKANELNIELDLSLVQAWECLPTSMTEEQLCTLVGNLVDNSLEALQRCDKAWISMAMHESDDEYCLRVSNNGPQITESLDRLCLLGFTSKPKEVESGIGLYLVQCLVDEKLGHMELDSDEKETSFSLYFRKEAIC